MAEIKFTIPNNRVTRYREVFGRLLHGASGIDDDGSPVAPATDEEISTYFEEQAAALVRQHDVNDLIATVHAGLPADPKVAIDPAKVLADGAKNRADATAARKPAGRQE